MLVGAAFLACCGIVVNRFVMTIQTLALPTLPFDADAVLCPELGGSGDISRRRRVRRSAVFAFVSLYDPRFLRKETSINRHGGDLCFRGSMSFTGVPDI